MALTQTATIPGPSWDEEVVPALRKRLQSESRTLSRRLSGLSLMNGDSYIGQPFSNLANASAHDNTSQPARIEDIYRRDGYQPPGLSTLGSSSARVNGVIKPKSVRNRTISQPYTPDPMRAKRKSSKSRSPNSAPRPTRIPKVSRTTPTSSPLNTPTPSHVNGFGQLASRPSGSVNSVPSESLASRDYANSSLTMFGEMSRHVSGLLDEPPPFPTTSMTSSTKAHYEAQTNEAPSRRSNESEERPFEHWYRGEVSRNGGVGELRVGRRQEMLEIANYGHKLAQRQREATARTNRAATIDDGRWRRKRADSVGEIGRSQRDSVYLDEQDAQDIGRVLDESPPTDLDGEGDDFSDTDDHHVPSTLQKYDSIHTHQQVGDISTASEPPLRSPPSRSSTPTPAALNSPSIQRPNGQSAIQSASTPRSSPESRVATPVDMRRGASEPPSSSRSTPSTPRAQRHQVKDATTPPSAQKRAVSPTAKAKPSSVKRTNLAKPKKQMTEDEKRKSVAVYPLSAGDGDMADAIPSWTQPKPKEGNWDEVVLPVVARKKGLEDQYEQADGSPQPKKVAKMVEPAPGTFGFKSRTPSSAEEIPMDEFGVPTHDITEVIQEEDKQDPEPSHPEPVHIEHDEIRLPVRHQPPPSPVPFSDYIPTKRSDPSTVAQPAPLVLDDRPTQRDDKDSVGCCQCVIM